MGDETAEVDVDGGSEGRGRLEVDGPLLKTVTENGGDLSVHLDRELARSPGRVTFLPRSHPWTAISNSTPLFPSTSRSLITSDRPETSQYRPFSPLSPSLTFLSSIYLFPTHSLVERCRGRRVRRMP
jgi:hypothetical protein